MNGQFIYSLKDPSKAFHLDPKTGKSMILVDPVKAEGRLLLKKKSLIFDSGKSDGRLL